MISDLKSQQFQAAISNATETNQTDFDAKFISKLLDNPRFMIFLTVLGSMTILLSLRPPFLYKLEIDKKRPWRATYSLSWRTFLVFILLGMLSCLIPEMPIWNFWQ